MSRIKFYFPTVKAKDAEVLNLLEKKDVDLEAMKKKLKEQEREKQSELLKLQMEVKVTPSLSGHQSSLNKAKV